jgi:hypothetical protein
LDENLTGDMFAFQSIGQEELRHIV